MLLSKLEGSPYPVGADDLLGLRLAATTTTARATTTKSADAATRLSVFVKPDWLPVVAGTAF